MKKTLIVVGMMCLGMMAYSQDVKTTFQTAGPWKPLTDVRADAVMVYGANNRPELSFSERVESWRKKGYVTHFMTGIAWGNMEITSQVSGMVNPT